MSRAGFASRQLRVDPLARSALIAVLDGDAARIARSCCQRHRGAGPESSVM
jgi:hypothetical protein